ncbi:hypothetical protein PMIN05_007734 [Paraphaeosphaeria minitans]
MKDNDVAGDMRSLVIDTVNDNDDTPSSTPRSGSPAIMVTPPGISTFTMFPDRMRQNTPVVERPRLRRYANTAPSGTLQIFPVSKPQFMPQTPRRATIEEASFNVNSDVKTWETNNEVGHQ